MSYHSISTLEPLQQTVCNKSLGSLTGQSAPTLHSRDPWLYIPPFQPHSWLDGSKGYFGKVPIQKNFKLNRDKCRLVVRNDSI